MLYDPNTAKTILFGGFTSDSAGKDLSFLNDTWAYDSVSNTWTDLQPSGELPAGRLWHALVFDPGTNKVLLFGGYYPYEFLNDTWAYDVSTNRWTDLKPAGDVTAMRGMSMAYDPVTKKVILFGGYSDNGMLDGTWAYDSAKNEWTELHPSGDLPIARCGAEMVYDSRVDKMILFGGESDSGCLSDTWAYDSSANRWTLLETKGEKPMARSWHTMAYDPAGQVSILFGGLSREAGLLKLDDTWTLRLER